MIEKVFMWIVAMAGACVHNVSMASSADGALTPVQIEDQQKLLSGIVEMSKIDVMSLCQEYREAYPSIIQRFNNKTISENFYLKKEFDQAKECLELADIGSSLNHGSDVGSTLISSLERLRNFTNNGFYQHSIIYSNMIEDDEQRDGVRKLVDETWQLLLQAKEILVFKVSLLDSIPSKDKIELNEVLADLSEAICLQKSENKTVGEAADIAFALSALLGNKGASSEIRSCDEYIEDDGLHRYKAKFCQAYGDKLGTIGVRINQEAPLKQN
ncbi:MAG: hypothetical protein LBF56_02645 [Holosporales bacterium]|jgi:hypothetical protein|nr:hypothetical protein [Holosporales bacterium]